LCRASTSFGNGRDKPGHDGRGRSVFWIAEDMALAESGAPYGPGLDAFGLPPERLLTVSAARPRDLLWAMEEALRCRAIAAVIGEVRHGEIDMVALRRLSLAAAESGALALLLRGAPASNASTAATRWIVGAAPNDCFAVRLTRNRRGPLGSWILQWSDSDERFLLATHAQLVAAPALDRPYRQVA
jgi:protein ImuA